MSLIAASLLMLAADTGQRTIDYWMVDDGRDIDRESIVFVERSALFQRPDGWINFSFQEVRNGSRLKTVKSRVVGTWVNCKTREFINDFRTEYGRDGAMLQQGKLDEQRRIPAPGSSEAKVLAFACGDTRGATQLPKGANVIVHADTLYAQGHPQVAKAPATPAAPAASAPAASADRPADYWLIYDGANSGYEDIRFVNKSSVSGNVAGWTYFDYVEVLNGSQQKKLESKDLYFTARVNCQTREFANEHLDAFSETESLGFVLLEEPPTVVARGSTAEKLLTFVCGNTAGATQLPRGADTRAYADDIYARGRDRIAKAPVPQATPTPARAAVAAPGLGRANWKIIALNPVVMTIYAPATVTRGNGTGQAWFTEIYPKPKSLGEVAGVNTAQYLWVADCARNTWRGMQVATYDAQDRLIYSGANPNAQPQAPVSGSIGQLEFNILCGRPVTLFDAESIEHTVPGMREIYATFRAFESLGPAGSGAVAPAQAAPTPARPAEAAPGLGKANWRIISDDDNSMLIYAPATVRLGQGSGQAWFTRIFAKPQNIDGTNGVVTLQFLQAANCKLDSLALTRHSQYGADGRVLFASVIPDPAYTATEVGSSARTRVDILCGRPAKLPDLPSYDRDVAGMREVYRGLRKLSEEMSDIINGP